MFYIHIHSLSTLSIRSLPPTENCSRLFHTMSAIRWVGDLGWSKAKYHKALVNNVFLIVLFADTHIKLVPFHHLVGINRFVLQSVVWEKSIRISFCRCSFLSIIFFSFLLPALKSTLQVKEALKKQLSVFSFVDFLSFENFREKRGFIF